MQTKITLEFTPGEVAALLKESKWDRLGMILKGIVKSMSFGAFDRFMMKYKADYADGNLIAAIKTARTLSREDRDFLESVRTDVFDSLPENHSTYSWEQLPNDCLCLYEAKLWVERNWNKIQQQQLS